MELEQRCKELVEELKLAKSDDVVAVVPLTGGVASDIAMIDLGDRKLCAKFALPKLKVAADWRAPVHRNLAEYAWLKVAAATLPISAVELFGRSDTAFGFAMEYLEGEDVYLWKDNLLREVAEKGEARKVADLLGKIHANSAVSTFDQEPFHNRDDFHALRIEPYLAHTRMAHPYLTDQIGSLETMLYESDEVLTHGDASPKNILFRDGAPVVLDAECATMGNACFDPAFCLNHLVLKAIHLPQSRPQLLRQVAAFWTAYSAHVDWEEPDALEARVCALLPVLMLARIDGKSPVEYLSRNARRTVREISIPLISAPVSRIEHFATRVAAELSGKNI